MKFGRRKTALQRLIARARFEILQVTIDLIQTIPLLPQPDIDRFEGRSRTPVKYIAKMRVSTLPV